MMRSLVSAMFGALVLAGSAAVATAEFSPRVRQACTGDAQRLCPRQKLGTPEMRYCMESRARNLSSSCVRALEDDGVIPRGALRR